jgi:spore maturation protein CgeB
LRILLVGIGYRGYPQTYAHALRTLGHEVELYIGLRQYHLATRLHRLARVTIPNIVGAQRNYLHSEQARFRAFVSRSRSRHDLVLFANADRLATDAIVSDLASRGGVVGLWLLDDVGTIATSDLDFRSFDRLASFNESQAAELSSELGRKIDFVPQGFAPITPDPRAPWSPWPLIVGAPYPSRREAALSILGAGVPIEVVGRRWPKWVEAADDLRITGDVTLERSVAMSGGGRICVNGHRSPDTGVSPRVFEVGGAGGVIVTDNVQAPRFFEPNVEMLSWSEPAEAADHVQRIIREPRRGAALARRAQARVSAEHTIAHRFRSLLGGWGLD